MKHAPAALVFAFLLALFGCSQPGASEQKLADSVTRAVYDNNMSGVVENFDDSLKKDVTRTQIAALSDAMHNLGDYKGLDPTSNDTINKRYEFQAKFDKGTMIVQMRLNPDGKIAAYQVVPPSQK